MSSNQPVFVIDDEEPVRTSLSKLLRALGIPSQPFPSAEAFLASYPGDRRGCLLVDIRMPGMSGLDLIEELDRRHAPLPAIVMTGHADYQSLQRLTAYKTLGFLEKPFSVDQLKALIDRWQQTLDTQQPS